MPAKMKNRTQEADEVTPAAKRRRAEKTDNEEPGDDEPEGGLMAQMQKQKAKNLEFLESLAIDRLAPPPKPKRAPAPKKVQKPQRAPSPPSIIRQVMRERDNRGRRARANADGNDRSFSDDGSEEDLDDDSDGDSDDDSDDEVSFADDDSIPLPRRMKNGKASVKKEKERPSTDADPPESAPIQVEDAKTGRSKCRRCMSAIGAGERRVGVMGWMVGRQVLIWQYPRCFMKGLSITEEVSGRGKCKYTKRQFSAGELKLSVTAHTTTNHFKLDAGAKLLRPALVAAYADEPAQRKAVDAIDGLDKLGEKERNAFMAALFDSKPKVKVIDDSPPEETNTGTGADESKESETAEAEKGAAKKGGGDKKAPKQPPKGSASRASGQVCWKFAGHLCFGKLLPNQETKTHCYARTHKGNTKILTKGLTSWWIQN